MSSNENSSPHALDPQFISCATVDIFLWVVSTDLVAVPVPQNPLPFPIRITKPAATADLIYIDIEVYFNPEGGTPWHPIPGTHS